MLISDVKQFINAKLKSREFNIVCFNPMQISFRFNGRTVKLAGNDCIGLMEQTFFTGYSNELDVKDKVVVDIGASIGDTAMLFAFNGARKVYAIEPMKSSQFLIENIKKNNLSSIIVPLKIGIGKECGVVSVKSGKARSSDKLEQGTRFEVKIFSLKGLIEKFGIEKDSVVKMDCEGCEFGAILSSDAQTLRHFNEFLIEIHGKPNAIISKFVESGFKTERTELGSYKMLRLRKG